MSYNPFRSAFTAAAAELTSPAARRYYSRRAQQDIQAIFVLVFELACMAYELGAQCRQWVDDLEQSAQATPTPQAPAAISAVRIAGLLTPAQDATVNNYGTSAPYALAGFAPIALLMPAPKAKRTRKPAAPKSPAQPTEAPAKGKRGRKPKAAPAA